MNTENNKLIAEFMAVYPKDTTKSPYLPSPFYAGAGASWDETSKQKLMPQLQYHDSWDWLMPVVEKIETILHDDSTVHIEYNRCWIDHYEAWAIIDVVHNSRLEAVYKAVIEFIKWYNENK